MTQVSSRDRARSGAVPQYGNRPQEGAAEANITASCKGRLVSFSVVRGFSEGEK